MYTFGVMVQEWFRKETQTTTSENSRSVVTITGSMSKVKNFICCKSRTYSVTLKMEGTTKIHPPEYLTINLIKFYLCCTV